MKKTISIRVKQTDSPEQEQSKLDLMQLLLECEREKIKKQEKVNEPTSDR